MAQSEGKIGSLFYGMTLDTKEFKKRMKEMRKLTKTIGEEISDTFKTIAKGGAIVGGALAAGTSAMLLFTKSTLEATNAQLLLADSIGATQSEIAGLELATTKWGVETSMVIDKMREVGGIDEFKKLADDVKNAGDEQDQLNKAVEIFGGEGAKMLSLLQQGSEGFADMESEARKLGLALSPDQIAESRIAWEEYENTILSLQGIFKQISTSFLEPLGTIASGVRGFVATFKDDIIASFEFIGQTVTEFIKGAFNLFAEFGIPFINGFISFIHQMGEAFNTLFQWLDPAAKSVFGTLGSLFSGLTDFIATFKQSIIIGIAKPIELVLRGVFNGLALMSEFIGDILSEVVFGLAEIGVVSEQFAGGLAEAFEEQRVALRKTGKDLAEPFVDAQKEAFDEMVEIFSKQNDLNESQIAKFKGFINDFSMKFNNSVQQLPVVAVKAAEAMTNSISDRMSGMILSGSQEEARLRNQSANTMLAIAKKSLKTEEETLQVLKNLETF